MITSHPHLAALADHALNQFIGLKVELAHEGRARLSFPVIERMLVPVGTVHAGIYYAACDFASYAALMSELAPNQAALTHDLHVSVMRSAGAGEEITILAEVVKRGRQLVFCEAKALSGERLLATARITKSIVSATA
jgi:uncharacterized protein (TIGR00369 family)